MVNESDPKKDALDQGGRVNDDDFIPDENNIIDFVAKKLANNTTINPVGQRSGNVLKNTTHLENTTPLENANHDVDENVQGRRQQTASSAVYTPIVFGWIVLLLGIIGAGYAIVKSSPQPAQTEMATTPVAVPDAVEGEPGLETVDQDESSQQNCRVRSNGEMSWEALALDATDAIKATPYRDQISFVQRDCGLIAKVLADQTISDFEGFQQDIQDLVEANLSPQLRENVNIEFRYY